MLEVCRHCGSLYEVVDEDDTCPECERRREENLRRSKRAKELEERKGELIAELESKDPRVQQRIERAEELAIPYKRDDYHYAILSSGGDQYYEINLLALSCTCQDYLWRKAKSDGDTPFPCKHLLRVGLLLAEEEVEKQEKLRKHTEEAKERIEANQKEVKTDTTFYV